MHECSRPDPAVQRVSHGLRRRNRAATHDSLTAWHAVHATGGPPQPAGPPRPHLPPLPPTHPCSVLVNKGALPGSNGSDTRANAAGAGLIIIFVGG